MTNELLWIIYLLLDFGLLMLSLYFFGPIALYCTMAINIILCNFQVLKLVDLFSMETTLGNILYASCFFTTDLIGEVYGKEAAKKAMYLGFFLLVLATIGIQFTLLFEPAVNDVFHPIMQQLFSLTPRVTLASLVAYFISQSHDIWAYHYWYKKTHGKHLWLRNNCSTLVSQSMDTAIFIMIAFWGVYSATTLWSIFISSLVIKWLVAILDTPFMYLGRAVLQRKKFAPALHPASYQLEKQPQIEPIR